MRQVTLPWAQAGSRFTYLFEAFAIDVLRATDVKKAAALLRVSWDEAWHLMERAVLRGRAAKGECIPTHIGIDEKAIAKGHRYMTLVCDLKEATVEYIGEERKEASLAACFEAFPEEARESIEAIGLDMWPAYISACRDKVPQADAKMVFAISTSCATSLKPSTRSESRSTRRCSKRATPPSPRASTCG